MSEVLVETLSLCCYAYVGLPHNVVKLRLQTQGHKRVYKGVTHALVRIAKEEGIRALGKGGISNLASCLVYNAMVGAVGGISKKVVATLQLKKTTEEDVMTLRAALEASITALFASTVTTVPENITCKLQFQRQQGDYRGPLNCVSMVLKREGIVGLFRGYSSVLLRDVPATPIVIGVYHAITPIMERAMARYGGI